MYRFEYIFPGVLNRTKLKKNKIKLNFIITEHILYLWNREIETKLRTK